MSNMKKAIIFGYKGMLGEALVKVFKNDFELVLVDKENIDIIDFEKVKDIIEKEKPDFIFNCAAINAVDKIEEDLEIFELAKKINGEIVGKIAKICANKKIIFVHYSTDYVFDGNKKEGYSENDQPDPLNKYGKTKLFGEELLQKYGEKYYLVRLSRLFGKTGTGDGVKKSFVNIILNQLKDGKVELNATNSDISCPTYSLDLAKFSKNLIEKQMPFGIYHGANNTACSWFEWAKEIVELSGYKAKVNPVNISFFSRLAEVPEYSELLNTKMPQQRTWQEALKEYLKEENI